MYKKIALTLAFILSLGAVGACADTEAGSSDQQVESMQQQIQSLESELDEATNQPPQTVNSSSSEELSALQNTLASVEQERDDLLELVDTLENDVDALQAEKDDAQAELFALQADFAELETAFAPLADLSEDEISTILLALDEEEAARQAEAAEREKLGYETGITFDQLARTPDDYTGDKVKFTGEVVQVMEGDEHTQYRFAVDGDYDQMIYMEISKDQTSNNRVLEDDEITIYGVSYGLFTYQSTGGSDITIPGVLVDRFEEAGRTGSTETDPVQPAGGPIQLGEPFTLGDYEMTLLSFEIVYDYDDAPALKYTYDWTNNSDETTYASITFRTKAFQDGVETSDNTIIFGDLDLSIGQREVKPGGSISSAEGSVGIDDLNKPMLLEMTEMWNFDSDAVYTYEIADLNNLP